MLTVHMYACVIMLFKNVHMMNLDELDINNYVQEVSVKHVLTAL